MSILKKLAFNIKHYKYVNRKNEIYNFYVILGDKDAPQIRVSGEELSKTIRLLYDSLLSYSKVNSLNPISYTEIGFNVSNKLITDVEVWRKLRKKYR